MDTFLHILRLDQQNESIFYLCASLYQFGLIPTQQMDSQRVYHQPSYTCHVIFAKNVSYQFSLKACNILLQHPFPYQYHKSPSSIL